MRQVSMSALAAIAVALASPAYAAGEASAARHEDCGDMLPDGAAGTAHRPVTTRDIAMLRDIGGAEVYLGDESPLSLSPDGKTIAFALSRAHPDTNSYCQALLLLPVTGGGRPRIVAAGGEFLSYTTQDLRGLVTPTGMGKLIRPVWSPDGRWLAYLRRDGGRTRLWRAAADGSGASVVAEAPVDIESVAWTPDGSRLVFTSRPGLIDARAAIAREARSGYRYDERFTPLAAARPQVRGPLPIVYSTLTLTDRRIGAASPDELRLLMPPGGPDYPPDAALATRGPDGGFAWTARAKAGQWLSPTSLWAGRPGKAAMHCTAPDCGDGILGTWWSPDGRLVRFLRRDGQGRGELSFYAWRPGAGAPQRVFSTTDELIGCIPTADRLLCLREGSTQPARIVLLNPATGRAGILFDPNPDFQALRLGTVRRLHWRTMFGAETYGDLVLPPDRRPGEKLPMIVVQYHSRGFLRGGTGDEYPIHAFAAKGFAVLSVERPPMYASLVPPGNWPSWKDAEPENVRDWNERRSLASSVLAGVDAAVALGMIDPDRIGLTGLSDGMTTASYLLSTTDRFAATAISNCCADPKTDQILGGPAWEAERQRFGYPLPTEERPDFWRPVSLAMNASRIRSPLLMQLADDEYVRALETYSAFRYAGPPVDMYVFPDEHHVKWQPAHRLAIYDRNLDWFSFWLQGRIDPDPGRRDQFAHWTALRATARQASAAAP